MAADKNTEEPIGYLSLCNLLYDIEENRISGNLVSEFVEDIIELCANGTKGCPGVFKEVAKNGYLFQGKEAPPGEGQYSRVIVSKDLHHNVELQEVGSIPIPRGGRPLKEEEIGDIIEGLEFYRQNPNNPYAEDVTCGSMRTGHPFAWVTRTERLEEIKGYQCPSDAKNSADAARRYLGLLHFKKDRAIEIKYPRNSHRNKRLRVPTSFEGCPSGAFRSRTGSHGWGCTVNLADVDEEDGYPEAVHEQVEFTICFELEDLGDLPNLHPPFDKGRFLETFPDASNAFEVLKQYVR